MKRRNKNINNNLEIISTRAPVSPAIRHPAVLAHVPEIALDALPAMLVQPVSASHHTRFIVQRDCALIISAF